MWRALVSCKSSVPVSISIISCLYWTNFYNFNTRMVQNRPYAVTIILKGKYNSQSQVLIQQLDHLTYLREFCSIDIDWAMRWNVFGGTYLLVLESNHFIYLFQSRKSILSDWCRYFRYWVLYSFSADIISTVEFNYSGDLLATGDKGGRVVIFQREQEVSKYMV